MTQNNSHRSAPSSSHRPGYPAGRSRKAAAAIISAVLADEAPLHQLLGSDSLAIATGALERLSSEIEQGRALAVTTDIRQPSGEASS